MGGFRQLVSMDRTIYSLVEKSLIFKLRESSLKLCDLADKNHFRNYTEFEQLYTYLNSPKNVAMQRRAAMAYCTHNLCIKEPHSAHLHNRPWPDFSGNELWTEHSLRAPRHFPHLEVIVPVEPLHILSILV